jgi:hypothetical protein
MLLPAVSNSWRLFRPQASLLSGCQCYSTASPPPVDPLVAELVRERIKSSQKKDRYWARPDRHPDVTVDPSKVDLPPITEWRKHFPSTLETNHRVSIRNPDTAAIMADAFVPEGSKDKVIIESFPGEFYLPVTSSDVKLILHKVRGS